MKYYYCLIDQIDGMKSCDLESSQSSYEIEPKTANRSINIKNIKRNKGNVCYFKIKSKSRWSDDSRIIIYPSVKKNVDAFITQGTSR